MNNDTVLDRLRKRAAVRFSPALVVSKAQIDTVLEIVEAAVRKS